MSDPVVQCTKHLVNCPPNQTRLKLVQAFRQECAALVDQSELDFYRRTATFRALCPKRHRIHCVWDFSYGRDLPASVQSRFVRPDKGYILVTLTRSRLEQAYWVPYKRSIVDRQNPQYIVCRIGSLQIHNRVLCSLVNFSNLPYSDRMCVSCLMERLEEKTVS